MTEALPGLSGTIYIPDTSALIENPDGLDQVLTDGNVVVLLHQVVEELGRLQASRSKSDGVRHAARQVTRKILDYRNRELIHHHVEDLLSDRVNGYSFRPTPGGGILAWEPDGDTMLPYPDNSGDNLILAGARRIAQVASRCRESSYRVVVISEDSNVLLKCDAVGIEAENLRYGKVELESIDQVYTGTLEAEAEAQTWERFLESGDPGERFLPLEVLPEEVREGALWNAGVVLHCGEHLLLTRVDLETGRLLDLRYAQYWDRKRHLYKPRSILGMTPRDPFQTLAVEFMLDPTVQLVVLDGPAGSGKTRLMMAAALYLLVGQPTALRFSSRSASLAPELGYDNGLIMLRPEHASSQYEMGFLPGDYEAKLTPWLEPFFQAIRSLSHLNDHDFLEELQATARLQMLSTSMLRGLDIEQSLVTVDELQNGDRHLAKTLMSRFCDTSKVILAGCLDPIQIDNPYVDWRSNALTRIKETYKGFGPQVAQVRLANNYRGPISNRADLL